MSKVAPSASADEAELERLDDEELARLVREREHEPTIKVGPDELLGPDEKIHDDIQCPTCHPECLPCHSERSEES